MASSSMFSDLFDSSMVLDLFDPEAVIYLFLCIAIMVVAKWLNDLVTPSYKLDEQLTSQDNKALGVAFAGYLGAVAIIVWSVLTSPSSFPHSLWYDVGMTAAWSGIGIVLLLVSRVLNDKLLLRTFNNTKEIIQDRNVGTGAVLAGTYLGTALIIRPIVNAPDAPGGFGPSLISALVYFVAGQIAFIAYGYLYQKIATYDLHEEIEKDNAAVGFGFGMHLVAIAILLGGYLARSESLVGLVVWFFIASFLLFVSRFLIDKVILPKSRLDDEMAKDQNWGAALIAGIAAIGVALIINGVFSA